MSISTKKNKGGRPKVDTKPVMVRLSSEQLRRLDDFRRLEPDLPNRPEGIRRLLDKALKK
jgi:hypothetical protein